MQDTNMQNNHHNQDMGTFSNSQHNMPPIPEIPPIPAMPPIINQQQRPQGYDFTDLSRESRGEKTEFTIEYILSRIDIILHDKAYIEDALETIRRMEKVSGDSYSPPDTRAEAIQGVVAAREATNQQMLRLYERMYEDLRPQRVCDTEPIPEDVIKLQQLRKALEGLPPQHIAQIMSNSAQQMFVKPGADIVSDY